MDGDFKSEIDFLYKCHSKDGEWNLLKQLTFYFSLNIKCKSHFLNIIKRHLILVLKSSRNDQIIKMFQDYIDLIFKVPFQL